MIIYSIYLLSCSVPHKLTHTQTRTLSIRHFFWQEIPSRDFKTDSIKVNGIPALHFTEPAALTGIHHRNTNHISILFIWAKISLEPIIYVSVDIVFILLQFTPHQSWIWCRNNNIDIHQQWTLNTNFKPTLYRITMHVQVHYV